MQDETSRRHDNRPRRQSVDLSLFPDLTVVYLGFRISTWRGVKAVLGIGRGLDEISKHKPEGLLAHETFLFSLNHIGIRQYWRDFDMMETFTRSEPHKTWWAIFGKDTHGAGFWHEVYRRSGGMEGLYISLPKPIGFGAFAPERTPTGPYLSSRERIAA